MRSNALAAPSFDTGNLPACRVANDNRKTARLRLVSGEQETCLENFLLSPYTRPRALTPQTLATSSKNAFSYGGLASGRSVAGHVLGEYDAQGKAIEETVWLGDLPVAVMENQGDDRNRDGHRDEDEHHDGDKHDRDHDRPHNPDVFYIASDQLGSPRTITNDTGSLVWSWNHAPFGNSPAYTTTNRGEIINTDLRFPGQVFDEESGNNNNGFRDYNPAGGFYLESDPRGLAAGVNGFVYALGNPVTNIDPFGLDTVCIGTCRVLGGNPNTIGQSGGFSTMTPVPVTNGSAAIIPQQWTGISNIAEAKAALAPYIASIQGQSGNTLIFSGITEVIGGASPIPGMNVRDALQQLYPGVLIIELPGGNDMGIVPITVTVPNGMSCPVGTAAQPTTQ